MSDGNDATIAATTSTVGLVVIVLGLVLKFCNCFTTCKCTTPPDGCGVLCRDRTLPHPTEEMVDAFAAAKDALTSQVAQLNAQVTLLTKTLDETRSAHDRHMVNMQRFYEDSLRHQLGNGIDQVIRVVREVATPRARRSHHHPAQPDSPLPCSESEPSSPSAGSRGSPLPTARGTRHTMQNLAAPLRARPLRVRPNMAHLHRPVVIVSDTAQRLRWRRHNRTQSSATGTMSTIQSTPPPTASASMQTIAHAPPPAADSSPSDAPTVVRSGSSGSDAPAGATPPAPAVDVIIDVSPRTEQATVS